MLESTVADKTDALVSKSFTSGVEVGLMEAHKLLNCLQQADAADTILRHWHSILARAKSHEQAAAAVAKAAA